MNNKQDYITPVTVSNLSDLFYERVKRSLNEVAYRYYDESDEAWKDLTWNDIAKRVELWHTAFRHEGLQKCDRVAIMMRNCPDWVIFDQAAYSLGLVVVPIYTNDRTENIRFILEDANVKVFYIEDPSSCKALLKDEALFEKQGLKDLKRIITHKSISEFNNSRLVEIDKWLPSYTETIERVNIDSNELATIVYT